MERNKSWINVHRQQKNDLLAHRATITEANLQHCCMQPYAGYKGNNIFPQVCRLREVVQQTAAILRLQPRYELQTQSNGIRMFVSCEKMTVAEPVRKLPMFCRIRSCTAVFTKARY